MTYTREQLEEQVTKTFEEIRKLYEMAQDVKIEAPKEGEDEEEEMIYLAYDVANATFPLYVDNEYYEIEAEAEGLQKRWTEVDG